MPRGPINLSNPVNRAHRFNRNRLAWWLALPGRTGSGVVFDLMNGWHGAVASLVGGISPWIESSRYGNRQAFDQTKVSSPNITIANSATGPLAVTDNFTIACWCFFTLQNGSKGLMGRYHAGGDNSAYFRTYSGPTDALEFGGGSSIHTTTTYPLNKWTHCAATMKAGTATIYINGVDGGGSGSVSISTGTSGWRLGDVFGNSFNQSGYQDGWSIWNEPFSAQDMYDLYQEEYVGYPQTLNYWQPSAAAFAGGSVFVPAPYYYRMLQVG
jgi:hypothetical protein